MQIWITWRKIHYQAEPTVVSGQAGGVNDGGSIITSVKKSTLCQSPAMFATHWTTSRVLQLSDVNAGHIFDNFLCLAMWSWLLCLQKIPFPEADGVMRWGISAMELHLKLLIVAVKKCWKFFFVNGHFLAPKSPWECLLKELLRQWKDFGSTGFKRPCARWPLYRCTKDRSGFTGCLSGRYWVITLLFKSDSGPGNIPIALAPKWWCICNWQFAKPLKCFLENTKRSVLPMDAKHRRACATPLFGWSDRYCTE